MKQPDLKQLHTWVELDRLDLVIRQLKTLADRYRDENLKKDLRNLEARLNTLEKTAGNTETTYKQQEIAKNQSRDALQALIRECQTLGYFDQTNTRRTSLVILAIAILALLTGLAYWFTVKNAADPPEARVPALTDSLDQTVSEIPLTGPDTNAMSTADPVPQNKPTAAQPESTVVLWINSKCKNAPVLINGKTVHPIAEGLSYKKVTVPANQYHTFKIGSEETTAYIPLQSAPFNLTLPCK